MKFFGDIHTIQLNKHGEELCGDQVRVLTGEDKTRIVLSDGLGSGVKANILSTLTAEIIIKMLQEEAPLKDVMETIAATLPVCKDRKLAYATFSVIEMERESGKFRAYNFDNPSILFFHHGKYQELPSEIEKIGERKVLIHSGRIIADDFLAMVSDGVIYAGLGIALNYNWSLVKIAEFIEKLFIYHPSSARSLVQATMAHTRELYGGQPEDDASMVGMLMRASRTAMVFTGPPLNESDEDGLVERLMSFDGERIVCGGTTGKIVSFFLGENVETDMSTSRENIPPIGYLEGIDLVTEGILTLNKAAEWIDETGGDINRLPVDRNGAVLLARSLLSADEITFLVGQKMNPFYQNPLLPLSVNIRKSLVEKIAAQLTRLNKHVKVEYF